MTTLKCKKCHFSIQLGENPQINQQAKCPECGAMYEIVWLFPLEVIQIKNDKEDQTVDLGKKR
jgi:lysine biosynthesis protein LysW